MANAHCEQWHSRLHGQCTVRINPVLASVHLHLDHSKIRIQIELMSIAGLPGL